MRCVAFWSSSFVPGEGHRWVRDADQTRCSDLTAFWRYLLVSVLLALAPPPALREPLEEEEPSESEDELLMLSLS